MTAFIESREKRELLSWIALLVTSPSFAFSASYERPHTINALSALRCVPVQEPWFVQASASRLDAKCQGTSVDSLATDRNGAVHWVRQWLELVVKYQQNPLRAARSIAYTQVAMHDAWLLCASRNLPMATRHIGAHRAASLVLQHFYPNELPGSLESQFVWLSTRCSKQPDDQSRGEAIGTAVARSLIDRSLSDGAGRVWPIRERPKDFRGIWQATSPLYAVNPTEPLAGEWRTWLKPSSKRYQPPIAPRPDTEQHTVETLEVLNVARNLTPSQREIAEKWNLDAGSVTPAGIWMRHTVQLLLHSPMGGDAFESSLAVLAAVAVTMEDALIACWRIKYRDWSERPITAIQRDFDSKFLPALVTPGFPSYVSGHATLSGACSTVLTSFWPALSASFTAMAEEAAMSRLWGGIHFRSDNDEGLKLGRSVGNDIVASRN